MTQLTPKSVTTVTCVEFTTDTDIHCEICIQRCPAKRYVSLIMAATRGAATGRVSIDSDDHLRAIYLFPVAAIERAAAAIKTVDDRAEAQCLPVEWFNTDVLYEIIREAASVLLVEDQDSDARIIGALLRGCIISNCVIRIS